MKFAYVFAALLLLPSAASADTVYKYRRADGRIIYSNEPVPGAQLIESVEYKFPAPTSVATPANRIAANSDAEGEARITRNLAARDAAWQDVQDATRALALAEERLRAGEEPMAGERVAVAAAPSPFAPPPAPPDVGGPISLPASVGGVPAPAAPAVGGPMSGRRGRPSPEYVGRMQALEADVAAARTRLDAALRR